MGERLSLDALRVALRALGVDRVESFGGPLLLEKWDPYGMNGVNRAFCGGRTYFGEIRTDADGSVRVVDALEGPIRAPFLAGSWPMLRACEGVQS